MSDIDELVAALSGLCEDLNYRLSDYLREKVAELHGRRQLTMRPSLHLSDGRLNLFLREFLDRDATSEELERARKGSRSVRLSEDQRVELERMQNDRCAVCGRFLDESTEPHVDHRVPLALGGADDFSNCQLLCGQCNMGKGKVPVWQVGVPYMTRHLTRRLRYCVLARAQGYCQYPSCPETILTSELRPILRIPAAMGGPFVFDNLVALCSDHADSYLERRYRANLEAVRAGVVGVSGDRRRVAAIRAQQTR